MNKSLIAPLAPPAFSSKIYSQDICRQLQQQQQQQILSQHIENSPNHLQEFIMSVPTDLKIRNMTAGTDCQQYDDRGDRITVMTDVTDVTDVTTDSAFFEKERSSSGGSDAQPLLLAEVSSVESSAGSSSGDKQVHGGGGNGSGASSVEHDRSDCVQYFMNKSMHSFEN